jgi:hypothetical protein
MPAVYCSGCGHALPQLPPVTCNVCGTAHWRDAKPCASGLVTSGSANLGERLTDRGGWTMKFAAIADVHGNGFALEANPEPLAQCFGAAE